MRTLGDAIQEVLTLGEELACRRSTAASNVDVVVQCAPSVGIADDWRGRIARNIRACWGGLGGCRRRHVGCQVRALSKTSKHRLLDSRRTRMIRGSKQHMHTCETNAQISIRLCATLWSGRQCASSRRDCVDEVRLQVTRDHEQRTSMRECPLCLNFDSLVRPPLSTDPGENLWQPSPLPSHTFG